MPHKKAQWRTQSVLLRKSEFPTIADARRWLLTQRVPYRADRIEDSAVKPGGLPVGMGAFWRARQYEPTSGAFVRMLPLGSGKRRGSVMLVRELRR
jgi:hypothetical protein